MTRKVTNRILELCDEGVLNPAIILPECLSYLSEDQLHAARFIEEALCDDESLDDDRSDDRDGDHESALASAGFGTDEDYGYYGEERVQS